ncbi:hypothetical protein C5167_005090 [Papaver somniferum]|uniref:Nucleoplasmin-like domain-containing protein n=1 Tax=Papaver somniferum TaxID=3469 RepID=A0A4Y7JCQ1_PAPSO|nr:hypothetical protein C5167_005090 [Papaver somniferum]
MSFWGVEVQPGKPVIQRFSKARGKLHISQATVSSDAAANYTIHCQCNVRDINPILLYSFQTTYQRSCPIDLEFGEEDGDIVLSVISTGGYGVHLTGYYTGDASFKGHDAIGKKKPETENVAKDDTAENTSGESQSKDGKNKMVQKMKKFNFGLILKMMLLIFLVLGILGGIISKFESYEYTHFANG